ncbi:patatin-like phospholipase family protein [Aestuariivirga sp.]|uniref:patatin-like phospholipase family protein n=1 Tax=Aestuariivirga sp. TaxID=2650926 RepID=UPI0039E69319
MHIFHLRLARLAGLAALLLLASCAGKTAEELRDPVPEALVQAAALPGYGHIRYWGDDGTSISPVAIALLGDQQTKDPKRSLLVVSGGGSNGAFGAGILCGWTASGSRPAFNIVTGISTGSLVAPFAFLGPAYDRQLKKAYTEISGKDIYRKKGVLAALGSDSAADNGPLRNLVARYVDDALVEAIAREYARGRRLLIGTTNLDAERPVVWDIGAIAASGQPGRKELIQDVLVASASIPGVFPPVRIKVVADGKTYDELQVDGGTSNQAFLFPSNLALRAIDKSHNAQRERALYIIRNGKVAPEYSQVKPRAVAIAGKAIASLIRTQGIGDLYRMYANAQRDGIAFNALWVPASFEATEPEPFDPAYMKQLFDLGYRIGKTSTGWAHQPP